MRQTPLQTPDSTDDQTAVQPDVQTADKTEDQPDVRAGVPWDPRGVRRLVKRAGIAVLVVVLLVVVLPRVSGGGDSREGDHEGAGADAPESGARGGAAPGAGGDGAADGSGGDEAGGPAADLLALGPAVPAQPGSYELKVVIDDRAVSGTYTVEGEGASQVHRTELDGSMSEQELSWRGGVQSLVATTDAAAGTCRWSPAPVLVPAEIEVGTTWETTSDCAVSRSGATLDVHQTSTAEVVERGQTAVGGKAVEVWVVQRHETQTRGLGEASVVSDVLSSELVAPQLGLVLERLTRADVVQSDGSTHTVTIVEQLQELP